MTVNHRKKADRYRRSRTHGAGHKKRRGAGNRGGRGMAGTGKRADQRKPSISKDKKYFGKYGFFNKNPKPIKIINILTLEQHAHNLTKEGDFYIVDLNKLGFDKLLSKGNATKKYKVTGFLSKGAKEKIEKAGGQVAESKE